MAEGAQQWDADKRRNFANDPANLQATTGAINEQKGDGDAATWLPPNKSYRCTYVSRIVDVKATYGLWVTQAEHDAIARILSNCGAPAAARRRSPWRHRRRKPVPNTFRRLLPRCPMPDRRSTTRIAKQPGLPARRRSTPGSPDTGPG